MVVRLSLLEYGSWSGGGMMEWADGGDGGSWRGTVVGWRRNDVAVRSVVNNLE
jgi:hypothetical protein